MSNPCNSLNVQLVTLSKLPKYSNLMPRDFIMTIQSSSYNGSTALYSRRTTFSSIVKFFGTVTGSYTGSFSGSFKGLMTGSLSGSFYGRVKSKNISASGSLSGSFYGSVKSKNISSSGSLSDSFYGRVKSKNISASGSLSGSFYGSVRSKNISSSGSLSGSYFGSVRSKNLITTGSLSGGFYGSVRSKNISVSGSLSGSYFGSVKSKNTSVSGSLSGSYFGRIKSKNLIATGSLSGSFHGKLIGITGTENINNVTIGANTPSTIRGTSITASVGFLGDLKGDVYSQIGIKVLENGEGGVSGAYFYGTSSYSLKSVVVNGVPNGGNNTFALTKVNGNDYNVQWSNIKKLFVTPSSVTSSINLRVSQSIDGHNQYAAIFANSITTQYSYLGTNTGTDPRTHKIETTPIIIGALRSVEKHWSPLGRLNIKGNLYCRSITDVIYYSNNIANGVNGGVNAAENLRREQLAMDGGTYSSFMNIHSPLTIKGKFSPETDIIHVAANSGITTITVGSRPVTKLILSKSLTQVIVDLNAARDVKIYIQTCSNASAISGGGSAGPFKITGWSGSLFSSPTSKIYWDYSMGIPKLSLHNTHIHISHRTLFLTETELEFGELNNNSRFDGTIYQVLQNRFMGTFKKYSRL